MNSRYGEVDRDHISPAGGGMPLRSLEGRRGPNLNALYLVMVFIAVSGFIALKTFEAMVPQPVPEVPSIDAEATLEAMLEGLPSVKIAGLVFFGAGVILLLIYIALRLAGLRPIRQEPQNRVRWTLGALVKGLVIAFFLLVMLSVAVPIALAGFGLPLPILELAVTAAVSILSVVWILFMLKFEYGARPADAGLSFRKPLRHIGYAFLTYVAIFPVFTLVALGWKWLGESLGLEYRPQSAISWLLESDSLLTILPIVVSAVVIAPVLEEFFFRGFTYPALRRRFGIMLAIFSSSAYFALIHRDFFSFMPIMILGIALAFLYERCQSIVAPAALHFFHNARAIGMILFLKYMSS